MTRLAMGDELLDGQLLRAVGHAPYGGADIGECLATASRIDGADLDSWHAEWKQTADSVRRLAEDEQDAERLETARLAFLRASNYYRSAGVMLMGIPLDSRLVESVKLQSDCFGSAAELLPVPAEPIEVPFDGYTLPGYFFAPDADGRARATVILIGGYDGTLEELYFSNAAAALARGYNVLAFDGPGQGRVLVQHGRPIRADWETVVSPLVDFAVARNDVDPDRIAAIGLSLGAHLAPRAASGEKRLAACIADCGSFDLYQSFLERLPGPLSKAFAEGDDEARNTVGQQLDQIVDQPTAGWSIRRGMLVHGVSKPLEYIDSLAEFSLKGLGEKIECPTWVASAEGDPISASAPDLFAALRVTEKRHVVFSAAEGAGDHCEGGARLLYHARSFGWLDQILRPTEV